MKRKTKKIIWLVCIGLMSALLSLCLGCSSVRSSMKIGSVESSDRSHWSCRYILMNGTMEKNLHPKNDTLRLEVTTESGKIAISIEDSDGKIIFYKKDIETNSFEVPVSGKVVVKIATDNHKGSFSIE